MMKKHKQTDPDIVYDLVHDFWKLPAVVRGIQLEFWKFPQNATCNQHIVEIWEDLGLYEKGKLTSAGLNAVKCKDLFDYEALMLQDQLFERTNVTNPNYYSILRGGLSAYAEIGIHPQLKMATNNIPVKANILDYCGGSGGYLEYLLKQDPQANGYIVDKSLGLSPEFMLNDQLEGFWEMDFKENPEWFKEGNLNLVGRFDLVMLNEILHCCSVEHQNYLIESSLEMLVDGGYLLITEQMKNPYLDWRLRTYTKEGECSVQAVILDMLVEAGMTVITLVDGKNHWLILAQKNEV